MEARFRAGDYRLVTSNLTKLREYGRLGLPMAAEPGLDLPEVDGTPDEVMLHKSAAAGPGTVVEDTVLEIDGQPMVDIRWRLDEIAHLVGSRATFVVSLAANDGETVRVWRGVTDCTLVAPATVPQDAFGFDPFLAPDGAGGLSLHDLQLQGRKDEFSARARAVEALLSGDPVLEVALADIGPWQGGWQSGPKS